MRRPSRVSTLALLAVALALPATVALARPAKRPRAERPDPRRVQSSYDLRLASDWPQMLTAAGCVNGGEETLIGSIDSVGTGRYAGVLKRQATIRFCGGHGPNVRVCTLTLRSQGSVNAAGTVMSEAGRPILVLQWRAVEGATAAAVEGSCDGAFKQAVRDLYLSVSHSLEIPLDAARGGATVRLEDFGWVAELR